MLATKERIIARRQVATDRFIRSTKPVFWVDFSKNDGGQFTSDDATGHLCTVTEALWTPSGRKFDATNDRIVVPHHTILNGGAGLTLAIWYKSDDLTASRSLLVKNDAVTLSNSYLLRYDPSPANLLFRVSDGTVAGSGQLDPSISTGIWYLFMGIKNGADVSILKNGNTLNTTNVANLGSVTVVGELWVGGDPRNTVGELAGLGGAAFVWNYAFTFPEARRFYLEMKWKF